MSSFASIKKPNISLFFPIKHPKFSKNYVDEKIRFKELNEGEVKKR